MEHHRRPPPLRPLGRTRRHSPLLAAASLPAAQPLEPTRVRTRCHRPPPPPVVSRRSAVRHGGTVRGAEAALAGGGAGPGAGRGRVALGSAGERLNEQGQGYRDASGARGKMNAPLSWSGNPFRPCGGLQLSGPWSTRNATGGRNRSVLRFHPPQTLSPFDLFCSAHPGRFAAHAWTASLLPWGLHVCAGIDTSELATCGVLLFFAGVRTAREGTRGGPGGRSRLPLLGRGRPLCGVQGWITSLAPTREYRFRRRDNHSPAAHHPSTLPLPLLFRRPTSSSSTPSTWW
jgi:hypothetical protein